MRIALGLLCGGLLLTGCLHHPKPAPASGRNARTTNPVIQPDLRTTGEVEMVNSSARFVVLSFPPGPVSAPDQHLNVYRQGLKVGELKVTGPQRGNDTVADILAGEIQVHDEVREE